MYLTNFKLILKLKLIIDYTIFLQTKNLKINAIIKNKIYKLKILGEKMAPDAGFEPATKWLTATYSTAELIRNKKCKL